MPGALARITIEPMLRHIADNMEKANRRIGSEAESTESTGMSRSIWVVTTPHDQGVCGDAGWFSTLRAAERWVAERPHPGEWRVALVRNREHIYDAAHGAVHDAAHEAAREAAKAEEERIIEADKAREAADTELFDAIWALLRRSRRAMIDYRNALIELMNTDGLYTFSANDMVRETLTKHGDLPE